jgi:hypothetical protein
MILNQIKHLLNLFKEPTVENKETFVYTEEQLMARLKFFIGICLSLTLFGIVFVVLYSLIFVTQPLNAISPIDQKFFELIVPIATFLTGTLSGIMLAGQSKEDKEAMLQAQKQAASNAENTIKLMSTPAVPTPVATPAFSAPGLRTPAMPTAPTQVSPNAFAVPASFTPGVVMSSTGKPMPVQPDQPEI